MQKVGILLIMSALLVLLSVGNANGHSDNRLETHLHHQHHHSHQLHQRQRSRKLCTACEPTTFFRFQQRPNGNNSVIVNKVNGSSVNDAPDANGLIKISAGLDANRYAITEVAQSTCVIHVAKLDTVLGKCVDLKGGVKGCQNDRYLDPANEDCYS